MLSLHPLSHLQDESGEWMTPPRHFQVFNAIEVSFSCFSLVFFCVWASKFRQSLFDVTVFYNHYQQNGFIMLALHHGGGGEGAVNAERRGH